MKEMNINDLLLNKEELPILCERCFQVPIHPLLIDFNTKLNPKLANEVFKKAAYEWYSDLSDYTKKLPDDAEVKNWIENIFLSKPLNIISDHGRQLLGNWEDNVLTARNGFATMLSISRNAGGSLYFNTEERSCSVMANLTRGSRYIRFSPEKIKEYAFRCPVEKSELMHIYAHHNIDYFPGALFLRNWAIIYLNEALKSIEK